MEMAIRSSVAGALANKRITKFDHGLLKNARIVIDGSSSQEFRQKLGYTSPRYWARQGQERPVPRFRIGKKLNSGTNRCTDPFHCFRIA
jgi:hypothetical protein